MRKTVIIGVTGSIAAHKTLDLITRLRKHRLDPIVIMTKSASNIVNPLAFEKVSGNKVYTELFPKKFRPQTILRTKKVPHIQLAQNAAIMIIAPATANTIAKIAHGIADDFLTTSVVASTCPIIVCPAMNTYMWTNPVTQQNIRTLRAWGMTIIDPGSGPLACGHEGQGRLADIDVIEQEILRMVSQTDSLKGKHIVVTSGGTLEKIDDIRFIANKSSGKMGAAIADVCVLRGASVTLLRSKTAVEPRYHMRQEVFETSDELERMLTKHLPGAQICFHVAAVSDYSVIHPFTGKSSSTKPLPLELTPRAKILDKIKKHNPRVFLVAFKAEWHVTDDELISLSKKRLAQTGADMIVANDVGRVGRGFQSDTNEVFIIRKTSKTVEHVPLSSKLVVAEKIIDAVST